MSDAPALAHPLAFTDKVRVAAVCALGMALFASVGWTVARPDDPAAAVSLMLGDRPWPTALVAALALAGVTSAVASVVAGGAIPEVGVLAVALGLATMSSRGGTMTAVLMYHGADPAERRVLATRLILETLLWFAAIVVAWFVGALVRGWLDGQASGGAAAPPRDRWARAREAFVHVRDGVLGMIACAIIASLFILMTIARAPASEIERGQVFFSLGIGFLLGAGISRQIWPKGAAFWSALSVPIVAVLAYGWALLSPTPSGVLEFYTKLAITPPNGLFRGLPIEYVGVGTAGAVLGHFIGHRMHHTRTAREAES